MAQSEKGTSNMVHDTQFTNLIKNFKNNYNKITCYFEATD